SQLSNVPSLIYSLSLHDALPIFDRLRLPVCALYFDLAGRRDAAVADEGVDLVLLEQERDALDVAVDALVLELHHCRQIEVQGRRSEEHTSELQSHLNLV